MDQVNIYIDGLNVYHRIAEYAAATKKNYRWLDYSLLLPKLLAHSQQDLPPIGDIHVFTSVPPKGMADYQGKVARLDSLILAWESRGLKIHHERFSGGSTQITDVNIALEMYNHAATEKCKYLYLISSDSDFVPLMKKIKEIEGVEAGIITPPYEEKTIKRQKIDGLSVHASLKTIKWKFDHCRGCSLPETFKRRHDSKDCLMPEQYATF